MVGLTDGHVGNHNEDTAKDIVEIFKNLAYDQKKCGIMVMHSKELAKEVNEVILLKTENIQKSVIKLNVIQHEIVLLKNCQF